MCGFLNGAEDPFVVLKQKAKRVDELQAQVEANKIEGQRKQLSFESSIQQFKSQLQLLEEENLELKHTIKVITSKKKTEESGMKKEIITLKNQIKEHTARNETKSSMSDREIDRLKNRLENLTLEINEKGNECELLRVSLDQYKRDLHHVQDQSKEKAEALLVLKSHCDQQLFALKSELHVLQRYELDHVVGTKNNCREQGACRQESAAGVSCGSRILVSTTDDGAEVDS